MESIVFTSTSSIDNHKVVHIIEPTRYLHILILERKEKFTFVTATVTLEVVTTLLLMADACC
jgi:hypothetical protein